MAKIHADAPMVPLAWSDRILAHRRAVGPIDLELITHPSLRLAQAPKDGRIVFGRSGDAVKLDPAVITDGESSNPVEQIFDTLVRYVPGTAKIEPALAESWSSDAEHKVWTFKIRPGVLFHDGTPCDAAAVANAFERQRDAKHKHHVGGEFAYWSDLLGYVEKVEVGPGEREVVFRCARPAPAFFVATLAVFTFGIPSPDGARQARRGLRAQPRGHRALPLRVVAERGRDRPHALRRSLGRAAGRQGHRLPQDPRRRHAHPGAQERRGGRDRQRGPRHAPAARPGPGAQGRAPARHARRLPGHEHAEEALRRRARAPGDRLRREQAPARGRGLGGPGAAGHDPRAPEPDGACPWTSWTGRATSSRRARC